LAYPSKPRLPPSSLSRDPPHPLLSRSSSTSFSTSFPRPFLPFLFSSLAIGTVAVISSCSAFLAPAFARAPPLRSSNPCLPFMVPPSVLSVLPPQCAPLIFWLAPVRDVLVALFEPGLEHPVLLSGVRVPLSQGPPPSVAFLCVFFSLRASFPVLRSLVLPYSASSPFKSEGAVRRCFSTRHSAFFESCSSNPIFFSLGSYLPLLPLPPPPVAPTSPSLGGPRCTGLLSFSFSCWVFFFIRFFCFFCPVGGGMRSWPFTVFFPFPLSVS